MRPPFARRASARRRVAALLPAVATALVLGRDVAVATDDGAHVAPAAVPTADADRTASPSREWRLGDDVLVTELAPGVWRHVSWSTFDGKRVPSNGLVLRDGDEIVLIDTAWGEEPTAALLDWVERELGAPVTRALATHSHEDRVGAPRTLAARGIPLLVHPKTAALAARRGVATTRPIEALATADAATLGGVEVFYPGPGHAPDNVVVWIPRARLLFGGCAVKSADAAELGNVADADVARWPDAIRAVQRRYPAPAVVVPGHGDPGDAALLAHTLDLLAARGDREGGAR